MFEGHDQAIYELLAERRLVDPVSLQAAFNEHQAGGQPLARLLTDLGLIDKNALLRGVAEHIGCACVEELPETLSGGITGCIGAGLAHTYGVVPIAADELSVSVAAVDPFNPDLSGDLAFILGRDVRVSVADPGHVQRLIQQHYGGSGMLADIGLEALAGAAGQAPDEAALTKADLEQLAGRTPIIRFVNLVLTRAIRDKASDIHFEPFEHGFKIRYRVDGVLCEMAPPPKSLALPVISRVKVLANLNIAERRLPQDGRIKLSLGGRAVDLRVSTLPTQFGESAVLRVLDQAAVQLELRQLGLPAAIHAGVEAVIRRPNGIFLVTGPTGSGKTTTLYSCLRALHTVDSKLLTVEDPVEYEIDGVMQVPVNPAAGLTFASALRTFLRQDPDIVMVGEIRDRETAQIAIQAALTGHLVLSTLHTNDAPSAVTRLVDMGIEPFLLASTLEAVLAQRLVRRICASCRAPGDPTKAMLHQLGADPAMVCDRPVYAGTGCPACRHTGYKGRLGIFEFLPMTDGLRELVAQGGSLMKLRQLAEEQGTTSLRAAGIAAILAGETTAEEILKYT